ncbi:MAG: class I SAM-dependent methyltransferase [Proteobacteria bacterium]|nr:class I SAM-dependent methyltransferase [Pseudomonadota bacterium]
METLRRDHLAFLREKVFQTDTKWPQFELLLDDLIALAVGLAAGSTVVSLERTLLYGGISLTAPVFAGQNFISVDCSPPSANERGAYNDWMTDDGRCIRIPYSRRGSPTATGLDDASADLVIVPNLVHHVRDQDGFFAEMARILRPGGSLYIFEPLVRELHQKPDDYVRYTPWGVEAMCERVGLAVEEVRDRGGPFEVISYCWTQALEYMPEDERAPWKEWFYGKHLQELLEMDRRYPTNLVRKHTSFPMTWSVRARRSVA